MLGAVLTSGMADQEGKDGSGKHPDTLGRCTECGHVYALQEIDGEKFLPKGTDGTCTCGNDEFEPTD